MSGQGLLRVTGAVSLEVIGASPEDFLSGLAIRSVEFWHLRRVDELTIRLEVLPGDMGKVRQCARKTMCGLEILGVSGAIPYLRAMGIRLLYPVVLLALVPLVFWIQGHILFISVSGNETVPSVAVLRALEEQGVSFWTRSDSLDMNMVKNRMLTALPELSWITINTEGSNAEVVVRERAEQPVISQNGGPANITAKKSGLITSIDAQTGTGQVKKGDLVQEGDLLISGVTALEWTTLLTRAAGEVYARTWTRVRALLPANRMGKQYSGRESVRWTLTLGKKTIKFYKTSGISYGEYDTITSETVLTLPGGYAFPVKLTRLLYREYVLVPSDPEPETAEALLEKAVTRQIRDRLTAGVILSEDLNSEKGRNGWEISGTVECREEIGVTSEIKE